MNKINEIQLVYSNDQVCKIKISNSEDAHKLLRENWNTNTMQLQEEFKVLLLDRASHVLGVYHMSKGGVSGTVVDIKLLLAAAIKSNASGIIIAHNHPSGNLKPSESDIKLTEKIKEACSILDIELLDHLILESHLYYSFTDEGKINRSF